LISNLLQTQKEELAIESASLIFSAQTKAKVTQLSIEEKMNKLTSKLMGAKPNKKNVIFIDDVNMPSVEVFGA
jgi:dynein heavy chain